PRSGPCAELRSITTSVARRPSSPLWSSCERSPSPRREQGRERAAALAAFVLDEGWLDREAAGLARGALDEDDAGVVAGATVDGADALGLEASMAERPEQRRELDGRVDEACAGAPAGDAAGRLDEGVEVAVL